MATRLAARGAYKWKRGTRELVVRLRDIVRMGVKREVDKVVFRTIPSEAHVSGDRISLDCRFHDRAGLCRTLEQRAGP